MDRPTATTAPAGRPEDDDEVSFLELAGALLRRRGLIVRTTILVGLVSVVQALNSGKSYTTVFSFVPQTAEASSSGLAGLANQFGIQIPGQQASESSQFYAELVTSRKVLSAVTDWRFEFEVPGAKGAGPDTLSGFLPDVLAPDDSETPWALRRERAIRWLSNEAVGVSTSRETGVIEVRVTTPWAGLSFGLAERLLVEVNEFNVNTRRSRAAAEREFVSGQLAEAGDSLRMAEARLEAFLTENRQWASSPELAFRHERLQRQVAMRQQLFTSLAQSLDAARIGEVRNTPVVTVVEAPELAVQRNPLGRIKRVAIGLLLGVVLGAGLALGLDHAERARKREGEEYRKFANLWAETMADVRSLTRMRRR